MSRSPISVVLQSAPLTLGIAAAAVLASGHWWTGNDIDGLVLAATGDALEPWRYLTATLPHVSAVQLIVNVFLFLFFGILLERGVGSLRFLGLFAVLAAGTSAAEFALGWGGAIGLSGVIYGCFAALWVLSRRDERYRGAAGPIVTMCMVGLFLFYVVATITGTSVATNFGNAAGLVLGVVLGALISAPRESTLRWASIAAGCFAVAMAGAIVGRPYLNLTAAPVLELSDRAIEAAIEGDYETSIELHRRLLEADPYNGAHWFNLGKALGESGRFAESVEALEKAVELKPARAGYHVQLLWSRAWLAGEEALRAFHHEEYGRSESLYRRAIAYDNTIPELWHGLGHAMAAQQEYEAATAAFRRALDLHPQNDEFRRAADWAGAWHLAFLAYVQFADGNFERSEALYRRALRTDDTVLEWWYSLGLALVNLDRLDDARNALERALALDHEDEETIKLLEWLDNAEWDPDETADENG